MYTGDDQRVKDKRDFKRTIHPWRKVFTPAILLIFLLVAACTTQANSDQEFIPPPTRTPTPGLDLASATPPPRTEAVIQTNSVPILSGTEDTNLNCTYSPYYWQNSPDVWLTENIIIGRLTYTKRDVLAIFAVQTEDVITLMLKQFFAAALNILKGADPHDVEIDISEASNWLDAHPIGASLEQDEITKGIELLSRLEAYNLGEIGPGRCSDEPIATTGPALTTTPTPSSTATRNPFLVFRTRTPTPAPTSKPPSGSPGSTAVVPTNTSPAPTNTPQPPQAPTATRQPTATLPPTNTLPPTPTPPPDATATSLPTNTPISSTPTTPPQTPPSPSAGNYSNVFSEMLLAGRKLLLLD